MMFVVPPMAIFAVYYGRYVRSLSRKTQSALGEVTDVAEERLSNIRTVFAFAREHDESQRYASRVDKVFQLARKEVSAKIKCQYKSYSPSFISRHLLVVPFSAR
jgi:ABC-type multidrug transport system fused ATPase/permease subunit